MTFAALELWILSPADDDDSSFGREQRRVRSTRIGEHSKGRLEQDAALFSRVRQGDSLAFEALFRSYYDPLRAFVQTIVRSEDTAADVVDDVFAKVWVHRDRIEVQTSVASYLFRAARNGALNVVRGRRMRDAFQTRWRARDNVEPAESASDALERKELARVIERLLAALPERRRVAVTLRWKAGLSHAEIAEILGITSQSVANLLNRALQDLRRLLPQDFT